jgi:Lhr-like helicase
MQTFSSESKISLAEFEKELFIEVESLAERMRKIMVVQKKAKDEEQYKFLLSKIEEAANNEKNELVVTDLRSGVLDLLLQDKFSVTVYSESTDSSTHIIGW